MVSPLIKLSRTAERKRKSPVGMTVVSPASSTQSATSPLEAITPTRRLLFARTPATSSTTQSIQSRESREGSELEQLKMSYQRKDGQLRVLHERFHTIQQGLGSIDQERSTLVDKAKKLEKEKKRIQKQLELREREILALVKRCASQEEKMRESSKLRSQNRQLVNALESVQSRLRNAELEQGDLYTLRKQLQESELAREDLQERLVRVQREHDSIADTLQECLANIRQLTDEKQHIEDERRRERKRAEIELEKQRLAYIQASNELKDDLETKQYHIQQMEKIIQENMFSNTSLRREKAIMSKEQQEGVDEVVKQYEKKISELEGRPNLSVRSREDYEQQLVKMHREIQSKEATMIELESEFSDQMQELMTKQGSLDEAEEEKKSLENKIESLQNLEHEHSALLEYVQIVDSTLADLTSENAYLILEKDDLRDETVELKERTLDLQEQLRRIYEDRRAKEGDFRDLFQAEKEELKAELGEALCKAHDEVTILEAELASRDGWISKVERELKEARRSIVQKEDEISRLRIEKEELESAMQASLAEARMEVNKLQAEIRLRDQQIASVGGKLTSARKSHRKEAELVKEIKEEHHDILHHRASLSRNLDDRREPPPDDTTSVERDTRDAAAPVVGIENNDVVNSLHDEISTLQQKCIALEDDAEILNKSMAERDNQLESIQENQKEEAERRKDLKDSLVQASLDLQSCDEQIDILEKTNSSLEIEAEAGRRDMKSLEKEREEIKELRFILDSRSEAASNEIGLLNERIESLDDKCSGLEQELLSAQDRLSERENQVQQLEAEYEESQNERAKANAALKTTSESLKNLEEDLASMEPTALEQALKTAQEALSEQQFKALSLEQQLAGTVKMQSEREVYNREACSRMAVLDDKITENNERSLELEDELRTAERNLTEREGQIKRMENKHERVEKHSSALESKLSDKNHELESIENELEGKTQQCHSLERQLSEARNTLSEREVRLESVEAELAINQESKVELGKQRSQLNSKVYTIEEEINLLRVKSDSLAEQLKETHKALTENESFVREAELKVAEKSLEYAELESKYTKSQDLSSSLGQSLSEKGELLAKSAEIVAALERASAILEEEVVSWKAKQSAWDEHKMSLEKNLSNIQSELSESADQIQALQGDLARNGEMYANLENELEESLSTNEKNVSSLEGSLKDEKELNSALQNRLSDADEEIALLEKEIQTRNQRIVSLERDVDDLSKNEVELAFVESEKQRMELERQLIEANNAIAKFGKDLENRESRLLKCEEDLDAAKKAFSDKDEGMKKAQGRCKELEKKAIILNGLLDSREDRLLKVDEELDHAQGLINDKDSKVESLQFQLRESLAEADTCMQELDQKIKKLDAEIVEEKTGHQKTRIKFESVQKKANEEERKNAAYQQMLDEQTEKLVSQEKELRDNKEAMESTESILTERHCQITKMTTELALKDDEIRDLRLVDLKDAEEAIVSLTEEAQSLKKEMTIKKLLASKQIEDIQSQNEDWKSKVDALTQLANMTHDQHKNQVESFEGRIQTLESAEVVLESRLSAQDGKLKERHATITSLSQKQAELEHVEHELRFDRDQLLKSVSEAKQEVEKTKLAIDVAITREREDAEIKLQKRDTLHRQEIGELRVELRSTEESLHETDRVLNDRSSLLSDMVDHNKDLESKLDKQQTQICTLEGEAKLNRKQMSTIQAELTIARENFRKKENSLNSKLSEERMMRDSSEKSLTKMKVQYNDALKAKKLVPELEKENGELKDKISRQEAYLQRKLQKDKVLRDRATPVCAKSGLQTPKKHRVTNPRKTPGSASQTVTAQSVRSDASPAITSGPRSNLAKRRGFQPIQDWELDVE